MKFRTKSRPQAVNNIFSLGTIHSRVTEITTAGESQASASFLLPVWGGDIQPLPQLDSDAKPTLAHSARWRGVAGLHADRFLLVFFTGRLWLRLVYRMYGTLEEGIKGHVMFWSFNFARVPGTCRASLLSPVILSKGKNEGSTYEFMWTGT